jgi:hypothetical protein
MERRKKQLSDTQRRSRREEIADWIETYHNITRKDAGDAGPKESI